MWEQKIKGFSKSCCSDIVICVYFRMQVGTRVSERRRKEERLSFMERHGYAFLVLVQ